MSTMSKFSPAKAYAYAGAFLMTALTSPVVSAQLVESGGGGDSSETVGVVNTFLTNIGAILSAASIAVVTIAIIFAGYQIAFNNKRISDVAPILVGGLLIGGAGQIATMIIGDGGGA